jgi:hypothetical protein
MENNSNEDNPKFQEKKKIYGDPEYSANEDIYNREKKLPFNEEVIPDKGEEIDSTGSLDEGLDVPG